MSTFKKNIFKITTNGVHPSQGCTLMSEPFLKDNYFQRSVVLLVDHTNEGSIGLILNKKTKLTVNSFFPELSDVPAIPIYIGGPVSPNHLFFIHTLGKDIIPKSMPVNDDLFFDGDFDALKQYILSGKPIEGKVKFFLGYSGWSKDQLEEEIQSNSWIVRRSAQDNILIENDNDLWKSSIESLGDEYKRWSQYPKDPNLN